MAQCPHAISITAMWPYAIYLITFCLKTQSCYLQSCYYLFLFLKKIKLNHYFYHFCLAHNLYNYLMN